MNRQCVKKWMLQHYIGYDTATALAEGCCYALDLYKEDMSIPEWLYEVALDYIVID